MEKKKHNFFVTHPVWAGVIGVLMSLAGFICLTSLPVEQYPDIAPPTVRIQAYYTGADANSVMKAVVMPIEDAVNGVDNMDYISSTADASGSAEINVVFKQGTDADMACVNVQNRVSKALGSLPAEVTKVGVVTEKNQNSILQISQLRCSNGKFDESFLANYLDINVMPKLKRIAGVGNVQLLGNTYALRVWLRPNVLAMYNITPDEIAEVLSEQNIVTPTGGFEGETYKMDIEYKGQLQTIDEFRQIVVKSMPDGSVLRICDIADVQLGSRFYNFRSNSKGQPAAMFIVNQAPGANATEVNENIFAMFEEVKKELPEGMEFDTLECSNDFLEASMHSVVETLVIAIILVVLVVYFFLQNFKATIIPSISILVSLLGTFVVVKLAGFSLNLLTLFALVLAIGTVVDDAIVVVEAVMTKLENGYKSGRRATSDAMREVNMAIFSCTLVFMAVFIPVTFMPGTSGTFFTQFGVTIASSVGLSMVCALTLCPALCAIMLKVTEDKKQRKSLDYYVRKAYNASYTAVSGKYNRMIAKWIKRPMRSFGILAVAVAGMVYLMMNAKEDLVPEEDQGAVMIDVALAPGTYLNETDKVLEKVGEVISQIPEVENYTCVSGHGMASGAGSNFGTVFVRLKNWEERSAFSGILIPYVIIPELMAKAVPEATIQAFQMPQIPGYGSGSFIDLYLQDGTGSSNQQQFQTYAAEFIKRLNESPKVAFAATSYSTDYPKYDVSVHAAQCKRYGVSPADVLRTLGTYLAGSYVSNYTQYGKVYQLNIQAAPEFRKDESALSQIYVRTGSGEMAPISQFADLTPKLASSFEKHFNIFPAIQVSAMPGDGATKSDVYKEVERVASEVFPPGYTYEYAGMAREEVANSKSNMTLVIYGICILLIYLILACLYNSVWIPWAVILTIPFALLGSYLFAKPLELLLGNGNNVYLQTGVIMLIGLVAKTAILITEFAVQHHAEGHSIVESAIGAAKDRLRPIMMTVMTMIIGMIPLAIEAGAGARGNWSLAYGVIGGMTVGTISLLFTTPAFYIIFQKLHDKFSSNDEEEDEETEAQEA
ncbi:MAG: efflux RND transporter permease subunit [Bacteroidales bacterium]|nr:efflux RND transporter permease subunit [Candidatus Physcousia equi]